MEKINGLTSENIVQQNIEKLKEIFPTAFSEGKLVVEELQALVGEYIQKDKEFYQMTWAGKTEAQRETNKVSTGTLRPCKEESKDWDSTENILIEGDNLEVLKLLQKSYNNKIKMIYIDPPYNTGKDFVYKDNYKDNLKNYLELTGQTDKQGKKFSTNTDSDGRYHSHWLNMMYPRLRLARNLMTDDGMIFISIGADELANLVSICNIIFGEENKVSIIVRQAKSGGNTGKFFSPNVEYILVYAKNTLFLNPFKSKMGEDLIKNVYNQIEVEGVRKGEMYRTMGLFQASLKDLRPNQKYFISCPDGSRVLPPCEIQDEVMRIGDGRWRWTKNKFLEELANGNVIFKRSKNGVLVDENGNVSPWNIYTKIWLKDREEEGQVPNDLILKFENRHSSKELKELKIPFDFAKPVELIKYLVDISKVDNSIILDFFAGSGTTAHAIMDLNAEDGGNRKCISIQLPEPTDDKSEAYKEGFKNVAAITKERIRRATELIEKENLERINFSKKRLDTGFRVFKLDSSNIKAWDTTVDNFEGQLEIFMENNGDHIKSNRTEDDVLFEILLKYGLELTLPIDEKIIGQSKIYNIGFGSMYICLSENITTEVAKTIGDWHKEFSDSNPSVIFKDSGFANDANKTNTVQTLRQAGIETVKSI